MTMSVARDFLEKVRCNCVCPARIHTPLVDGYLEKNYPVKRDEVFAKLAAWQPAEVAALVAFLVSDEGAFITGSSHDLDGGVTHLR
jgi:NAD(P)-dependent dehydrogenase (short-subunit alcohol dehydrogenase family)